MRPRQVTDQRSPDHRNGSQHLRYAYRSLLQNKAVNASLAALLILSAFLMATGGMVMERLIGSVDQLFDTAKPPHYLQMHKGDYDPDALARFASEHPEIDAWLIEDMLGFDGAAIAWQRSSTGESGNMADSLIDNLFVTQNEDFDFLLDQTGGTPRAAPGGVYVPVVYQQSFDLQVGDELAIRTDTSIHELRIEGFVRDSGMGSSLSSSIRFLVSEQDFGELQRAGGGDPEIIAEYRLTDASQVSALQRAYEADDTLPKNGQAVSYQMIRLINVLGDGLAAIAMVLLSLLLIAIALLNLRFVIRGTLEEEVREIGVMKAIGVPDKAIVGLYLSRYRLMTLLACAIGGALAVIASNLLTQSIRTSFAEAPIGVMTVAVPVLGLLAVYLFVIGICRTVFRAVRKVHPVTAMVHGSTLDERRTGRRARRQAGRLRRTRLASYRGRGIGRRLAFLDLRAEGRQWVLIPIVFFLATVLMALPLNLLTTFESPRVVTYLGVPESDVMATMQFSDDVDSARRDVFASMDDDDRLTDLRAFANHLYETRTDEGWETLRVEVGDYSSSTIKFVEGGRPETGQIALSVLNGDKYGLSAGDELTIRREGEAESVLVSGIYQDITSSGHTAKMQGEVTDGAAAYVIYADTVEGTDPAAAATEYDERFPAAKVIPTQEFFQQTLSYATSPLRSAAIMAFTFGIGVAMVITSLFLTLRLTRDRRKMGVLSAIGFSTREIIAQVRGKTVVAMAVGTLLGLVFVATVGESVVGALVSLAGIGVSNLAFVPNHLLVNVAYPLMLMAAGYLGAVILTRRLHGADKSLWLA